MQALTAATVALRRSGGTGRRAGLKIRCLHGRVGSSPTFGIVRAKAGAFARIERLGVLATIVVVTVNVGLGVILMALKVVVGHL